MMFCLDLINLKLDNIQLIEFSSRVKKNYILSIIYIRLLINIFQKNRKVNYYDIRNVLIINFLDSFDNKLIFDICSMIDCFIDACIAGKSDDNILDSLLKTLVNKDDLIKFFFNVRKSINKLSIYSIYKFFKQILLENSFGYFFFYDFKKTQNKYLLYKNGIYDFWRIYLYNLPVCITNNILKIWKSPENLLAELFPYFKKMPFDIYPNIKTDKSILVFYIDIINIILSIKKFWKKNNLEISNIVLERNKYIKNLNFKNKLKKYLLKINLWSNKKTVDFGFPKELKKFYSFFIYKKVNPIISMVYYRFFYQIYQFDIKKFNLKVFIFIKALRFVDLYVQKIKNKKNQFDELDLTNILHDFLFTSHKRFNFIKHIQKIYPCIIINNFQDIHLKQYQIFRKIYKNANNCSLILLADPRQSLYLNSIQSYINIKNSFLNYYLVNTNQISSGKLVNSINCLFSCLENLFFSEDFYFFCSNFSQDNKHLNLLVDNKEYSSISFLDIINDKFYLHHQLNKIIADYFALVVFNLLEKAKNNNAFFCNKFKKIRLVQPSDIVFIVKNEFEANLLRDSLNKYCISSLFFFKKKIKFKKDMMHDLLLLFKAIMFPNMNNIKCLLCTYFFDFSFFKINLNNIDENFFSSLVVCLSKCNILWDKFGLYFMLNFFMEKYNMFHIILRRNNGKEYLENIFIIIKFLDKIFNRFNNKSIFINWFINKIFYENDLSIFYKDIIDYKKNSVNIINFSQSRNLNFPIVFFPFFFNCKTKSLFFCNRLNNNICLNLLNNSYYKRLSKQDYLSKNMRLLYIVINCAIYHCTINFSCSFFKIIKNKYFSFKKNIFFYEKEFCCIKFKKKYLSLINNMLFNISFTKRIDRYRLVNLLKYKILPYKFWNVISYTSLIRRIKFSKSITRVVSNNLNFSKIVNYHCFPQGKIFGIFLHRCLEKYELFIKNKKKFLDEFRKFGISIKFFSFIKKWIKKIFNTPIYKDIVLSRINQEDKKSEFYFCLSIKRNFLLKKYNKILYLYKLLNFNKFNNILKGFIDLVFLWKDKYYILDYKFNWLGINSLFYNKISLQNAIIANKYDLQYQLYALALHRYLTYKVKNYNFKKNFGGIFYLFLRGINSQKKSKWIYFCQPDKKIIYNLDVIFS